MDEGKIKLKRAEARRKTSIVFCDNASLPINMVSLAVELLADLITKPAAT